MAKPIRPKDVARVYMHRFKYYIPNVSQYQRAARNALGRSRYGDHTALASVIYAQNCMTSIEMAAFDFTEFHALQGVYLVRRAEINILNELRQTPNWEHRTLMACVVNSIPGSLIGVYCFDNFVIDNRVGENGNVLWAKHQFKPAWRVLTDLDAIGEG